MGNRYQKRGGGAYFIGEGEGCGMLQAVRIPTSDGKYICKIRADNKKKYEVTYERHISELAKLREDSRKKGAWSAAINAEVARGKAAGLYVEQKIIRTGKLDDLSEDELDKRIAETLDEYSPILEGVTAEEIKSNVKEKQKEIRLDNKKDTVKPRVMVMIN